VLLYLHFNLLLIERRGVFYEVGMNADMIRCVWCLMQNASSDLL